MKRDSRIDDYIARAQPFARPILEHLRHLAAEAIPDGQEGIKWRMPHFMLNGKNVAGMAAFKAHCAFTVHGEDRSEGEGMGQCGKITALDDLPADSELVARMRAAVDRIANGDTKLPKRKSTPKQELAMPDDFAARLDAVAEARAHFNAFAPSYRRDYIEWITGAKRESTRDSRIEQAVEWIAEGKKRHWKYEGC